MPHLLLAPWLLVTAPIGLADPGQDTAVVSQETDTEDTDTEYVATGGRTVECGHVGGPASLAVVGLALLGLRRRLRPLIGLFVAWWTLGTGQAYAQLTPTLDANRFEPSGMMSGFSTTYTARQLAAKKVSFDAVASYGWRPLQASEDVRGSLLRRLPALEHLGALHLRLAVGATDWFQVSLAAPAVQIMELGRGLNAFGGSVGTPVAAGDIVLELAFRPLDESKGVGLAIIPFATAPTGARDYFLTDGVPAFGGRIALSGNAGPVHLAAHAGYKVKVGQATLGRFVAVDDEVLYGAGLGFQLVPSLLRLNVELTGATVVGPGRQIAQPSLNFESLHTALEATAGMLLQTPSGFAVTFGGGAGLTSAPGVPSARGYLGFGYVPTAAGDRDGDGIADSEDECLREPEDLDGFQDGDGCPDLDNDDDGLLDVDDRCPVAAEDADGFQDDDGCPDLDNDNDGIPDVSDRCPVAAEDLDGWEDDDGCPDVDNDFDGFLDPDDACPDHAEDVDGHFDDDGCPDEEIDRDGDGVLDPDDGCPLAAEDKDGFEDEDGCPDIDNDSDGIVDGWDGCPDDPEDPDGYEDADGCPEADDDRDGDGIADSVDKCPDEPEVVNGFEDDDGCPDQGKVKLTGERIEILERILFYTAEARIRPESFSVLDAVVAVMQSHPEIARVRIEGHTDSQGADAYNQDLSERRALAVRAYLEEAGVSPARLLSRGYGELYPVAPNGTADGRAQNRRVEFVILGAED